MFASSDFIVTAVVSVQGVYGMIRCLRIRTKSSALSASQRGSAPSLELENLAPFLHNYCIFIQSQSDKSEV